ncbi:MAG: portal protein [Spirochaetia bacterium]|nr:portal protein [Spirochaetia bacterium]
MNSSRNRDFQKSISHYYLEARRFYDFYLRTICRRLVVFSGVLSVIILVLEYGYYYPKDWNPLLKTAAVIVIFYLILFELVSFVFSHQEKLKYFKSHAIEMIIIAAVLVQWIFKKNIFHYLSDTIQVNDLVLFYLSISQMFFLISNIIHLIRNAQFSSFIRIRPPLVFVFSFLIIVCAGFFLLSMPRSTQRDLSWVDILFTAVSAVSVTGLTSVSVLESFTRTGQMILLVLIQIGGLGLMTLTSFFSFYLTGRPSVSNQLIMKDLLSEDSIGRVKSLVGSIALMTVIIEALGALYLYFTISPEAVPDKERIFYSVFHSISAFCNAGFTLYSANFQNLYAERLYLSGILFLVILGGLGFPVLSQILKKVFYLRRRSVRFSASVKIVIFTNLLLYTIAAVLYILLENKNTLTELSFFDSLFDSLFYSVTMRTAGFNIHSTVSIGLPMAFASLFFMWIGASPASTGGGIKTSTFFISMLHAVNQIRKKDTLMIFQRTIAQESISRAFTTLVLSLFIIFSGIFFLVLLEDFLLMDILFEVVSAFGTVGLSRGITESLGTVSKLILCAVMLAGRMGILTVLAALAPAVKPVSYRYPSEYIVTG